jgi:hypothetical protein
LLNLNDLLTELTDIFQSNTEDGLDMAIWYKPPKGVKITADIVFIHGLTGGRDSTWTAKGAEEPWPKLLPRDENDDEDDEDEKGSGYPLGTARIMSWGYDADIVKLAGAAGQNRVMDHARNLLGALEDVREGPAANRPLIFVAHSLGGLVVKAVSRYLDTPFLLAHSWQRLFCALSQVPNLDSKRHLNALGELRF